MENFEKQISEIITKNPSLKNEIEGLILENSTLEGYISDSSKMFILEHAKSRSTSINESLRKITKTDLMGLGGLENPEKSLIDDSSSENFIFILDEATADFRIIDVEGKELILSKIRKEEAERIIKGYRKVKTFKLLVQALEDSDEYSEPTIINESNSDIEKLMSLLQNNSIDNVIKMGYSKSAVLAAASKLSKKTGGLAKDGDRFGDDDSSKQYHDRVLKKTNENVADNQDIEKIKELQNREWLVLNGNGKIVNAFDGKNIMKLDPRSEERGFLVVHKDTLKRDNNDPIKKVTIGDISADPENIEDWDLKSDFNEDYNILQSSLKEGQILKIKSWEEFEQNFKEVSEDASFSTLPIWFEENGTILLTIVEVEGCCADVDVDIIDGYSVLANGDEVVLAITDYFKNGKITVLITEDVATTANVSGRGEFSFGNNPMNPADNSKGSGETNTGLHSVEVRYTPLIKFEKGKKYDVSGAKLVYEKSMVSPADMDSLTSQFRDGDGNVVMLSESQMKKMGLYLSENSDIDKVDDTYDYKTLFHEDSIITDGTIEATSNLSGLKEMLEKCSECYGVVVIDKKSFNEVISGNKEELLEKINKMPVSIYGNLGMKFTGNKKSLKLNETKILEGDKIIFTKDIQLEDIDGKEVFASKNSEGIINSVKGKDLTVLYNNTEIEFSEHDYKGSYAIFKIISESINESIKSKELLPYQEFSDILEEWYREEIDSKEAGKKLRGVVKKYKDNFFDGEDAYIDFIENLEKMSSPDKVTNSNSMWNSFLDIDNDELKKLPDYKEAQQMIKRGARSEERV